MNKTTFLTICLALLLVLNAITLFILYQMQRDRTNDNSDRQGPMRFISEQLKLDNDQQRQFGELRHEHQDRIRQIHEDERKLHDEYFNLLKSNNPDPQKVDSLASLMAAQQKHIELLTFNHFQDLRSICRDDQKKLFDETIDEISRAVLHQPPPGGPPPR